MHRTSRPLPLMPVLIWAALFAASAPGRAAAGDRIRLSEDALDSATYVVAASVEVEGKLYPQPGEKSAIPLKVEAGFRTLEKRLAGTGRQAMALRSIRYYQQAGASIRAGAQVSNVDLRDEVRLIVAGGGEAGVELHSPSAPLRSQELDLLRTAGDSLTVPALLPNSAVEPGDSWKPATWVLPFFTGIEAVEKSHLTCRLKTLEQGTAVVAFDGEIVGAVLGAGARIEVAGEIDVDVETRSWRKLRLTQKERRSVGAVSPGLDVVAEVKITRAATNQAKQLADRQIAGLPLDPNDANRLVAFDSPEWNVRFFHDRNWHLLNQNSDSSLLRLLEKGELIAQCSIKKLADAEPGRHVPEEVFQKDIQKTLGKNFRQIVQAEKIKLRDGLYVFRVVAVGVVPSQNDKGEEIQSPMQWIYYLVANDDGRQVALAFSVDPERAKDLKDRDLAMVGGVEFLKSPAPPTRAASRKP